MKKLLTLILALMLVLSVASVTGISSAEEERPVITFFGGQADPENAFTLFLEDEMNVDLQNIELPDLGNKISLMVMAGEELADVICQKVNNDLAWSWAEAGAVIDLTPYYEDPEFNANLVGCDEIVPGMYEYIRLYDGKFYSIPFFQRELHSNFKNKMWVNMTWLDELGLEVPTTLDEFRTVLGALKEAHPDAYTIASSNAETQGDFVLWIMNSFIYDDNMDHLNIGEDGKLYAAYTTDEWKEALLYIRGLIEDGLYDADFLTMDRDTAMGPIVKERDENGDPIVAMFLNSSNGNFFSIDSTHWEDYSGMAPMEGPHGVRFSNYTQSYATNCWFVTKDCDDPDLAVRIGIFMNDPTERVWVQGRYGVEGKHRLAPTVAESCYEGFPALFEQVVDLWATGGDNAIWWNNFPGFCWLGDQGMMDTGDPTDWVHKIPYATGQAAKYGPKEGEYVPVLLFTPDETEQINTIRTDLRNYIKETKVLFASGEMSIEDEWDDYIQTCWDIGLQEFLDVAQVVYERMTGK